MARSDIYKRIIIGLGIFAFIGCIFIGIGANSAFEEFNEDMAMFIGWTVFLSSCIGVFIFCMFLYMIADILDHLEIVSAQTTRSTKVLENFEENKK